MHESLGFPPKVSTATVFAGSGFYNIENHYTSDPELLARHLRRTPWHRWAPSRTANRSS